MTYREMEEELEYLYRACDELQRQTDEYGALGYEEDARRASDAYRDAQRRIRELQAALEE